MQSPLVSVIIPVYNCVEYLQRSLESVLSQEGADLEIILVDSSTNISVGQTEVVSDVRVRRYIQEPRGVSAARNLGIQQARGEYIAFQDADDEWLPEKLKMQLSAFRRHPDAGLVFTDTMMFRDGEVLQRAMNRHMLSEWSASHASESSNVHYGRLYAELLTQNCMNTSSVVVKRSVLEECGVFDEQFKVGEDYDVWLRIARSYPMIFIDRVLCKYRVHSDGLSGGEEVRGLRWLEAHLAVREKHRRLGLVPAEHVDLLNDILSRRSWEAGWNYFGKNHFHDARRHFRTALRIRPASLRIWLYWCCSFLPKQIIEVIRCLRQVKREAPVDGLRARH